MIYALIFMIFVDGHALTPKEPPKFETREECEAMAHQMIQIILKAPAPTVFGWHCAELVDKEGLFG